MKKTYREKEMLKFLIVFSLFHQARSACTDKCDSECYTFGGKDKCDKCKTGYYGDICEFVCSPLCDGGCSHDGGYCYACPENRWGFDCKAECSSVCIGGCSQMKGECNGCVNGKYGFNCARDCSSRCIGTRKCNVYNGKCESCKPGDNDVMCTTGIAEDIAPPIDLNADENNYNLRSGGPGGGQSKNGSSRLVCLSVQLVMTFIIVWCYKLFL